MPEKCKCGRDDTHRGRCWVRRGLSGPTDSVRHIRATKSKPAKAAARPDAAAVFSSIELLDRARTALTHHENMAKQMRAVIDLLEEVAE